MRGVSGFELIKRSFVLVITVRLVSAGSGKEIGNSVAVPTFKQRAGRNDPGESSVLVFRIDVIWRALQLLLQPVPHAFVEPVAVFQYLGGL
jgi:hypothetical protein